MPKKIKLIIADAHLIVREGYIALLKSDPKFMVVGEASNGKALIDLVKNTEADIIILDLALPIMSGDEALPIILNRFPKIRIIIVSIIYTENIIAEFLARGASAYLSKNSSFRSLQDVIHTVYEKGQYYNEEVSNALLKELKKERQLFSFSGNAPLTKREIEVLKLICQGKTNKEIGKILNITPRAIDFHRQNLYAKTDSNTTANVVIYALKKGIITIDERYPVEI